MNIIPKSSVSRTLETPENEAFSPGYLAIRDPGSPVASALNWVPDNADAIPGNDCIERITEERTI
jgi:hypothetical protein